MSETKQKTLDDNVKVGGKEIAAVLDEQDADELEILGWTVIFTVGNDFVVDREWLEARATELGIPHHLLPRQTSKKRAFGRAANRLTRTAHSWDEHEDDVQVSLHKESHKEYHVEVTDRRDGDVTATKVGGLFWDTDLDPSGMRAQVGHPERGTESDVDVTKGSEFYELFGDYLQAFKEEMDLMQRSNLGEDIRTMLRGFFTRKSASVKLRDGGAVYFAPVTTEEVVQAMKQLVRDLNDEWKNSGFEAEVNTIEVINTEEKREMVEKRARKRVEEQVGKAMEEALDQLDESDVIDEVVDSVEENLEDVEGFADTYNALLDVEIAVEDELEGWKNRVTEEQEELIDAVLED